MSITKEEILLYKNQSVEIRWKNPETDDTLRFVGHVVLLTDDNVTVSHPKFGMITKPIRECVGISENVGVK